MNDHLETSDQQYLAHLEEIKQKEEERLKKEKQLCEIEYKKYNEQFLKSLNNYETYMREKKS
jgi:hypothetical protein